MKKVLLGLVLLATISFGCVEDDPHSSKVLELGLSTKELYAKGVTAQQLYMAGTTLEKLVQADVPVSELADIDPVCLHDILMAGAAVEELSDFIKLTSPELNDLLEQGFGIGFLARSGYDERLKNEGYLGTLTDIDGNTYDWVKTGNQIWMADALRTSRYSDGEPITKEMTGREMVMLEDSVKCYLDPCDANPITSEEYCNALPGYCYTYTAATRQYYAGMGQKIKGVCPDGWRLPTKEDIEILREYTSSNYPPESYQSSLMAPYLWDESTMKGDDFYGFSAIPNGNYYYDYLTGFLYISNSPAWAAYYWTSERNDAFDNEFIDYRATYWSLGGNQLFMSTADKRSALCVRCILESLD
ncbi:hypothetical protein D1164_17465 [Mariniphaga sediminis]|uniref:Fibrobacter succinogenes major paralogous domain-containing protein n=1 Tax=Mariniphaga sediminis TaxID=1628158 RepID=A0A399CX27_9BACT|nr:fibrobacter succinogenes major paralogous domain-containing protein [Mariniphaga sediminis]RIH63927.1 hypothetical protein D1164_17465 [Mariniphaga sediminis]